MSAWAKRWYGWCAATLIAFYGGGRLGEILQCARQDLLLPIDFIEPGPAPVFLRLRTFKSKNRQNAKVQRLRIVELTACRILHLLLRNLPSEVQLFGASAYQYRKRWNLLLGHLRLPSSLRLTPGGLRGGFAVWSYRHGVPIQDIMWALRLRSQSTLESYLQETALPLTAWQDFRLKFAAVSPLWQRCSLFSRLLYDDYPDFDAWSWLRMNLPRPFYHTGFLLLWWKFSCGHCSLGVR